MNKITRTLINESIMILRCYMLEHYPTARPPLDLMQLEENLLDLNKLIYEEGLKKDCHTLVDINSEIVNTAAKVKEIYSIGL